MSISGDFTADSFTVRRQSGEVGSITLYEDPDDGDNIVTIVPPPSGDGLTGDREINTGDFGGSLILAQSHLLGQTMSLSGNPATVSGSSVVFGDSEFRVGKTVMYKGEGQIMNTNGNKTIELMADATSLVTITIPAADTGNFIYEIMVTQNSASLGQLKGHYWCATDGGNNYIIDVVSAIGHDWDTGATLSLQIDCVHASDVLITNSCYVQVYEYDHL